MQPTTTHPEVNGAPVSPPQQKPSASSRKKKIALIGSVAAIVALLIAAICLYLFWYQNPQKVVTDAIINMSRANQAAIAGDMNVNVQGNDVSIRFSGEGDRSKGKATVAIATEIEGAELKMTANVIAVENGDVYFQASDVQKAADELYDQVIKNMGGSRATADEREQVRSMLEEQFNPIVEKIDNRWIHLSSEDIKKSNPQLAKTQECMNEVQKMIREDKSATNAIATAYKEHQFVRIDEKLGSQNGALGYRVSIDKAASEEFQKAVKDAELIKKLRSCGDESGAGSVIPKESGDDTNEASTGEMKVWIKRWSHNVQKADIKVEDKEVKMKMSAEFDFVKKPSVDAPQESTPASDIVREIENLLQSTFSSAE